MEFKIVRNTNEDVLVEVIFADEIDKVSHKGFTGKEKYIEYIKGEKNKITLFDEANKPFFSFRFGLDETMVVSNDAVELRYKVFKFLLSQRIHPKKMSLKRESGITIKEPKKGRGVLDLHNVFMGGRFAISIKNEEIKDLFGEYGVYNTYINSVGDTIHEANFV